MLAGLVFMMAVERVSELRGIQGAGVYNIVQRGSILECLHHLVYNNLVDHPRWTIPVGPSPLDHVRIHPSASNVCGNKHLQGGHVVGAGSK
jgi:hypothetical protein